MVTFPVPSLTTALAIAVAVADRNQYTPVGQNRQSALVGVLEVNASDRAAQQPGLAAVGGVDCSQLGRMMGEGIILVFGDPCGHDEVAAALDAVAGADGGRVVKAVQGIESKGY